MGRRISPAGEMCQSPGGRGMGPVHGPYGSQRHSWVPRRVDAWVAQVWCDRTPQWHDGSDSVAVDNCLLIELNVAEAQPSPGRPNNMNSDRVVYHWADHVVDSLRDTINPNMVGIHG